MDDTELYADLNVDDPDQQEAKTLNLDDETISYLDLKLEDEISVIDTGGGAKTDLLFALDKDGNLTGNNDSIPTYAFGYGNLSTRIYYSSGFSSLIKTVKFDGAKSVGGFAFVKAMSLTNVDLPVCTSVGTAAFYQCYGLSILNLPACVGVGSTAFSQCTALSMLDLPVCTSVGAAAFSQCFILSTLILRSETMATLSNTSAFTSTPIASGTGYIYVPDALVDSYKTATGWKTFATQIKPLSELPA
jgi:hypothetical protein